MARTYLQAGEAEEAHEQEIAAFKARCNQLMAHSDELRMFICMFLSLLFYMIVYSLQYVYSRLTVTN
jgi:hypothetical protein